MYQKDNAFSVMVGLITASRIILRHWKMAKSPNLKDWVNAMVEAASYETMLNSLKGNKEDETTLWELFLTHIKTDGDLV